jgi:hypothetical protein
MAYQALAEKADEPTDEEMAAYFDSEDFEENRF